MSVLPASSPVTKGLLFVTGAFSLGAQLSRKTHLFQLDWAAVAQGQVWRLLTHNLVWSSSSELLLGSFLLYSWRLFERQFGSRKFAGCMLFHLLSSTLVQSAVLLFSRGAVPGGKGWMFSSGPYGLLFGLLTCFFFDIPQSAPFRVVGLPLSDKAFIYILALQVALSSIPASCYTAAIGLLLGLLYRSEWLPFHRIRAPMWLANCCNAVFAPLLSGSLFPGAGGARPPGQRLGGSGRLGGGPPAPGAQLRGDGYAPVGAAGNAEPEGEVLMGEPSLFGAAYAAAPAQPDPGAVQQLVSMGFSEAAARAALQASGNDVTAATNRLLGS